MEGAGDQRVLRELIKKHGIDLPVKEPFLVKIAYQDGDSSLFDSEKLRAHADESDLAIMGIVLDADAQYSQRLEKIRDACRSGLGIEVPEMLPPEGWVSENETGQLRFGLWMMPDNAKEGMLETFLAYLVPPGGQELWRWTAEAAKQAREKGATYKSPLHDDKARMHAYLAFQDEPGRQLHEAVINRILDPDHPLSTRFFAWFCRLFELTPTR